MLISAESSFSIFLLSVNDTSKGATFWENSNKTKKLPLILWKTQTACDQSGLWEQMKLSHTLDASVGMRTSSRWRTRHISGWTPVTTVDSHITPLPAAHNPQNTLNGVSDERYINVRLLLFIVHLYLIIFVVTNH